MSILLRLMVTLALYVCVPLAFLFLLLGQMPEFAALMAITVALAIVEWRAARPSLRAPAALGAPVFSMLNVTIFVLSALLLYLVFVVLVSLIAREFLIAALLGALGAAVVYAIVWLDRRKAAQSKPAVPDEGDPGAG